MSKPAVKYLAEVLPESQDKPVPHGGEAVNILIVDDLPEKLIVYKTILEDLNQNLMTASSGEEALKLVLKHEFAVILLDVNMTGMDGFETAAMIKARKKSTRTPIIFLTAFTDEVKIAQGYASGGVDYLPTPVVPEVLRAKVKVFIELFQMRQQAAKQAEERAKTIAAEEAARRKDEFLAMLAHELRNPLAPIRNALNLLKLPNVTPEIIFSSYEMMERQLQHMVRLVDDLMDVSRITRGRIDLRLETISLQEAIDIALETTRPLMAERKHNLIVDIPDSPILVNADLVRLSQIFANLLNNAGKYTDPDGTIMIAVKERGEEVTISITDTGIGIAPEKIDEVFDLFMQIDNSIERAQGGLGIGLTLVKNLIEMQKGTVKVTSDGLNKGSTFTITLPVVDNFYKREQDTQQPERSSGKARQILIVDDNQDSAQTLGWMLEFLGHQIHLAFDGPNAIELAKDIKPDVILLDIGLPKMNGYEICQILRQEPGLEKTVFVAQTGWGQEEHRKRSSEAGFHHHLVKPITSESLDKILQSMH